MMEFATYSKTCSSDHTTELLKKKMGEREGEGEGEGDKTNSSLVLLTITKKMLTDTTKLHGLRSQPVRYHILDLSKLENLCKANVRDPISER